MLHLEDPEGFDLTCREEVHIHSEQGCFFFLFNLNHVDMIILDKYIRNIYMFVSFMKISTPRTEWGGLHK